MKSILRLRALVCIFALGWILAISTGCASTQSFLGGPSLFGNDASCSVGGG